MSDFETKHTKEIVCPHCGHIQKDIWEIDFNGIDGYAEVACGECGKDFFVQRHAILSYSTSKL